MRIFYDVDTQRDFMNKDGALYVPNAELIKPNLRELTEYVRDSDIPIIGSIDNHFGTKPYQEREGELAKYGGPFPDHCMAGTKGQQKIDETKITWFEEMGDPKRDIGIYVSNNLKGVQKLELVKAMAKGLPLYPVDKSGIFFEKQSYDIFTNPAFVEFLDLAEVDQAIVYGVATDYCVKAAVLGMQNKGIQCYIIKDAIKGVSPDTTEQALDEMTKAGAELVTTKDVLEGRV